MELADVPRHRPLAFDKMESLIKEMQDPESGVPVRSQKLFLSFIPSAFMGYDLVEWLMDRFNLEESSNVEAINLGNQLCQYGYFFPVNDSKNLVLKDDSSLYRFQSPYYWPWAAPRAAGGAGAGGGGGGGGCAGAGGALVCADNVEYAIYLVKRSLRNKQRHGLEEYELEALAGLKKNLAAKWDFITMQAEEQVRVDKDRKKGDKIVIDSQERAYWRVARPPPGLPSALDACPVPARARVPRTRRRTLHQLTKEVDLLKYSLDRTRVKVSIALEALLAYSETFAPWDPWLHPPQPANPWVSDDTLFWQINSPIVEVPSEKRLARWALSMEELVADPTGLLEFTTFLRKEYSHENIRFWLAVMDLRRSSQRHVQRKLNDIYEEFLKPGAPCEINIDGATMERVAEALRGGSRFALDHAADHVYSLLLKKDCYPRFVRSEHFRILQAAGKSTQHKKRFFGFGGPVKKKSSSSSGSEARGAGGAAGCAGGLGRRRGSDRSLSGSAHELATCAVQPAASPSPAPHHHPAATRHHPPHSHSQSNLSDAPYSREPTDDESADVAPWDGGRCGNAGAAAAGGARRRKDSVADSGSSSSDVSGVAERVRRLPQQSTLDGGLRGAPPPLRRLSAVEPRHLAPLASPPRSPHPPPAPAASPAPAPAAPHPTPTISVSSAPDDTSPDEPPSSSRECVSEDPPSVFTSSREHSPPDLTELTALANDSREVSDSLDLTSCRTIEGDERPARKTPEITFASDAESPTAPAPASMTPPTDATAATSLEPTETPNVSLPHPTVEESTLPCVKPLVERDVDSPKETSKGKTDKSNPESAATTSTNVPDPTPTIVPPCPSSGIETPPLVNMPTMQTSEAGPPTPPTDSVVPAASTVAPTVAATGAAVAVVVRTRSGATVAPLAECEDTVDEELDKVPWVPPTAPAPRPGAAARPAPAHGEEHTPSAQTQYNIVKNDNKSNTSEPSQRNDICPWEDENSCETDAPFVKTYATLGYL